MQALEERKEDLLHWSSTKNPKTWKNSQPYWKKKKKAKVVSAGFFFLYSKCSIYLPQGLPQGTFPTSLGLRDACNSLLLWTQISRSLTLRTSTLSLHVVFVFLWSTRHFLAHPIITASFHFPMGLSCSTPHSLLRYISLSREPNTQYLACGV